MIPYYEKDAGIKSHEDAPEGTFYVVLDRPKVDALDPNIWNTFDAVKTECEEELSQFLDLGESLMAISPDGDPTYVVNFISRDIGENGGMLL
jgi:hypothetical protein